MQRDAGQPWDFQEALQASRDAELEQRRVEGEIYKAFKDYARKERAYRVALAKEILTLKSQGMAITACETVAKGAPRIAALREERDLAEGLKETAKHAGWRVNADRRDIGDLLRWSARRDLAEYSGPTETVPARMPTYGGQ